MHQKSLRQLYVDELKDLYSAETQLVKVLPKMAKGSSTPELRLAQLRDKYGSQVTYEDHPKAHIRTEFGFDMPQVAKNRYTSDRYHDFIGFEVTSSVARRKTTSRKNNPGREGRDFFVSSVRQEDNRLEKQLRRTLVPIVARDRYLRAFRRVEHSESVSTIRPHKQQCVLPFWDAG